MLRGEIWLINLDRTVDSEIRKTRPAVIVSDDAIGILPLKVIVPITEWKERYAIAPWIARLDPSNEDGLEKVSAADAFQVCSVAQERFVKRVGRIPEKSMHDIAQAPEVVLGLKQQPSP
jgi:mRNA interferase MazF